MSEETNHSDGNKPAVPSNPLLDLLLSKRLWAFERRERLIYSGETYTENGIVRQKVVGTEVEYSVGVLVGEAQVRWARAKNPNDLPLAVSNAAWI